MIATRMVSPTFNRMQLLNRALDRAFTTGWETTAARVWVPALDVSERNDAYLVTIELPGVDPQNVDISFEQNVLSVSGAKATALSTANDADVRVYANERASGTFERSIRLPEFVDGDNISAQSSNGLLEITIPKAQVAQPRKIEVKVATPIATA